jgi:hypothetical protein
LEKEKTRKRTPHTHTIVTFLLLVFGPDLTGSYPPFMFVPVEEANWHLCAMSTNFRVASLFTRIYKFIKFRVKALSTKMDNGQWRGGRLVADKK